MLLSPIILCQESGVRTGAGGRKRISKCLCANGVTVVLIADNPGFECSEELRMFLLSARNSSAKSVAGCWPNSRADQISRPGRNSTQDFNVLPYRNQPC